MKREQYPALTEQELSELRDFAAVEGRRWKSILEAESWWRGLPCKDKHGREYPELYGLRNTHGGAWLAKFKLEVSK